MRPEGSGGTSASLNLVNNVADVVLLADVLKTLQKKVKSLSKFLVETPS